MLKNKDLLTLLIRIFLGYIFLSAGVCKLTHGNFGQMIGPPWLEERLAAYGLGLFAQVVALSQVVCGALLLSQRFSLLGAVMLVPMNVAILAVTVSQQWAGTPGINAALLLLNLSLLAMEHPKFRFLLQADKTFNIKPTSTDRIGQNVFSWLGLGFCLLTLAAAPFHLVLTTVFAVSAFAAFALTLTRNGIRHKLDVLLLILPFVAMIVLTLGRRIPFAGFVLAGLVLVEALLLVIRLVLGARNRKGITQATAALS
ncbi:DoxX-like protein [Pontibacter ummariensis]|uniref:DoxX protein n=1 Tax=Pontibacter ummariensis TaxID=1610492 RepID=A0A239HZ21_9BACT|nr:DoxX family protein [Pontibacter ummariensis]PRY10133.1 DoxX-like protein [Pontibacter ummariensis]SNS86600.1 DoxX protein [Pontibacter ummariensis]